MKNGNYVSYMHVLVLCILCIQILKLINLTKKNNNSNFFIFLYFLIKEHCLTKEEIRKYLENDEAIDSIDYLIELRNSEVGNNNKNLLKNNESVIQ
jgi:hypothetical protein